MPSILLVCTANICRSPMAEALLRRLINARPDAAEWHVESAGTWAVYGCHAAVYSQATMQKMGIDISMHQSQPVSETFLGKFDLILTMESQQKEGLGLQWNEYTDRIYMLSEMVGVVEDIKDPIGGEQEDYQETAKKIEQMLSDGLDRIIYLAQAHHDQHSST